MMAGIRAALCVLGLILGLILPAMAAASETGLQVRGVVEDPAGMALEGATVYLRGTRIASRTDGKGRFSLHVPHPDDGPWVLVATYPGYVAAQRVIELSRDLIHVEMTLETFSYTETIEVEAITPGYSLPDSMGHSRLDALKTPGTSADVLRMAQMLPGLAKIDEGAGLFIRGGDVSETITLLDRAVVAHPYRYESKNGGFFGLVPTWQVAGFSLSTGGFPARYGNALSGVLELEGLDAPSARSIEATVGLATASAQAAIPLGDATALRLSGNKTDTRTLFELNGSEERFSSYPNSTDVALTLHAGSRALGRVRLFGFQERDESSVELEDGSFDGFLNASATNEMYSVAWSRRIVHGLMSTATLSHSEFTRSSRAGIMDLTEEDSGDRARIDLLMVSGRHTLRFGPEWERENVVLSGRTPIRGGDLDGLRGTKQWRFDRARHRSAGYVELGRSGRLSINAGIRTDLEDLTGHWTWDPRLSISWVARPDHHLRLAGGIYHQSPSLPYLDPDWGNPDLRSMRARHIVLGYRFREWGDRFHVRAETYHKRYSSLPVEDPDIGFSSDGTGSASGLDLLASVRRSRWDGWIGYSYLRARRRWTPWQEAGRYTPPEREHRPDFDIPHSIQLSATTRLGDAFSLGVSARWASGRPFTPVVGAVPEFGGFDPVHGEINSDRLPAYRRVDSSLSRSWPLGASGLAIGYLGITNIFNWCNTFGYSYKEDYSERSPTSSSGRTIYFGISLHLSAGEENT